MTPQIGEGSAGERRTKSASAPCSAIATVRSVRRGRHRWRRRRWRTRRSWSSPGPTFRSSRSRCSCPPSVSSPNVMPNSTMGAAQAGVAAAVLDLKMDDPEGAHCLIASVWVGADADDEEAVFANTRDAAIAALKLGAGGGPWHGAPDRDRDSRNPQLPTVTTPRSDNLPG